jgi:hypothetical protein
MMSGRLTLPGGAQELEHREKQYDLRLRIPVYVREGDTEKVGAFFFTFRSFRSFFYGCVFISARLHDDT